MMEAASKIIDVFGISGHGSPGILGLMIPSDHRYPHTVPIQANVPESTYIDDSVPRHRVHKLSHMKDSRNAIHEALQELKDQPPTANHG